MKINLTGQKFGRLYVESINVDKTKKNGRTTYNCVCDCGNTSVVIGGNLTRKKTPTWSCGCGVREFHKQKKKTNKYEECEKEYIVYSNVNENFFLLSKDDFDLLDSYSWYQDLKGYWRGTVRGTGNKSVKLHQIIAERKYGKYDKKMLVPDHLDRNKSNNTRENIQLKTWAENSQNQSVRCNNKSGVSGVTKNGKRWAVRIGVNGKRIYLGTFSTLEEAIKVREQAEKDFWNKGGENHEILETHIK